MSGGEDSASLRYLESDFGYFSKAVIQSGVIKKDVIIDRPIITTTGTVTGGTLTDGTATITGGTVTGTTLTDGTATLTNGTLTGITSITSSGDITASSSQIRGRKLVANTGSATENAIEAHGGMSSTNPFMIALRPIAGGPLLGLGADGNKRGAITVRTKKNIERPLISWHNWDGGGNNLDMGIVNIHTRDGSRLELRDDRLQANGELRVTTNLRLSHDGTSARIRTTSGKLQFETSGSAGDMEWQNNNTTLMRLDATDERLHVEKLTVAGDQSVVGDLVVAGVAGFGSLISGPFNTKITDGSVDFNMASNAQTLYITKVGKLTFLHGNVGWTSKNNMPSASIIQLTLPYESEGVWFLSVKQLDLSIPNKAFVQSFTVSDQSYCRFEATDTSGSFALDAGTLPNSGNFRISGFYKEK